MFIRRYFQFAYRSMVNLKLSRTMTTNNVLSEPTPSKQKTIFSKDDESNIVWVDLEMSGLDVNKEHILEMACIVTDAQLNIIKEGPELIIHQPDSVLDNMGEWCTKQHGQSGLTEAVRKSDISLESAEKTMVEFIQRLTPRGKAPLAGNSIHCDKMFLEKYMPNFMNHLHYRIIDVSSIKELCRRWYPEDLSRAPAKKISHRALGDIKESIDELKYYRKSIFK